MLLEQFSSQKLGQQFFLLDKIASSNYLSLKILFVEANVCFHAKMVNFETTTEELNALHSQIFDVWGLNDTT